jgi:hypothetical protein
MNETAEPAVVVCDANVLYSIVMTDLIISLGSGAYSPPMDKPDSRRMDEESAGR